MTESGLTPDGLLDPDVVFADMDESLLTPIGPYAEPCLIPEDPDESLPDCPACGIRHRFTVTCWGGGGSGR
jgi:hypothetical protein